MVPEGETLLGGCWGLGLGEQVGPGAPGRGVRGIQEQEVACHGDTGLSCKDASFRDGLGQDGRTALHPLPDSENGSPGLGAPTLPWPVVWSYPGPRLSIRRQWASVRWPECQPQVSRSKLQETSGGTGGVSTAQRHQAPPVS